MKKNKKRNRLPLQSACLLLVILCAAGVLWLGVKRAELQATPAITDPTSAPDLAPVSTAQLGETSVPTAAPRPTAAPQTSVSPEPTPAPARTDETLPTPTPFVPVLTGEYEIPVVIIQGGQSEPVIPAPESETDPALALPEDYNENLLPEDSGVIQTPIVYF